MLVNKRHPETTIWELWVSIGLRALNHYVYIKIELKRKVGFGQEPSITDADRLPDNRRSILALRQGFSS